MQSGTHVYDLGSRSRPPEAMDGFDMKPRRGKGVKVFCDPRDPERPKASHADRAMRVSHIVEGQHSAEK